ncbi:MAG TPA: hypothetical protein PLV93_14535, partial [Microthrixaceae bacterium]|nr:hypothetical protein [Microthrixaceae bacterium]
MDSVTPSSRLQGSAAALVTIDGANFVSGATLSLGAGVNVSSLTVVNSGRITAMVSIDTSATIGSRTPIVTNLDAGQGSLPAGFSVSAGPTVSSLSPSTLPVGASTTTVTITGTNFQPGATVTIGDSQVTVGASSYVSSTSITVPVSVLTTATPGPRTVTLTNPDGGVGILTNGFRVVAAVQRVVVVAENVGDNPGWVRQSGTFRVYASVTAASNAPTLPTVTADLTNLTGSASVGLSQISAVTIGGNTYNYRSAVVTGLSSLTATLKSYSVSASDSGPIPAAVHTLNGTVNVDNTAPSCGVSSPTDGQQISSSGTLYFSEVGTL